MLSLHTVVIAGVKQFVTLAHFRPNYLNRSYLLQSLFANSLTVNTKWLSSSLKKKNTPYIHIYCIYIYIYIKYVNIHILTHVYIYIHTNTVCILGTHTHIYISSATTHASVVNCLIRTMNRTVQFCIHLSTVCAEGSDPLSCAFPTFIYTKVLHAKLARCNIANVSNGMPRDLKEPLRCLACHF